MEITDTISADLGVGLVATGQVEMTSNGRIESAAGDIKVLTDSLLMRDGAVIRAGKGTVTVNGVNDLIIGRIEATENATADAIRLATDGRILDGGDTGGADLVATKAGARLTMQAKAGIGNAKVTANGIDSATSDSLELDVASFDALSERGSIYLTSAGPLNFGRVESGGDAILEAAGNITGSSLTAMRDVKASSGNDFNVDTVLARIGNVSVTAARNLTAKSVTAGESADIRAIAGDLSVSQISAKGINLSAGGSLALDNILAKDGMALAGTRLATTITSADPSKPLQISVTGPAGLPATLVDLIIQSPGGVTLNQFSVVEGNIWMPYGFLAIEQGYVGNRSTFRNLVSDVLMNNNNTVIQPADVQLYVPGKSFTNFKLDGWTTTTGPYVLNRDPDHGIMGGVRDSSAVENARQGVENRIGLPVMPVAALTNLGGPTGVPLITTQPGLSSAVQMNEDQKSTSQDVE